MTPIIYRQSANTDLAEIRKYYSDISKKTYENVISDIHETLSVLSQMPEAGFVYKTGRRRLVSSKYSFVINYAYRQNRVEIIGIYRFQDR